MEFIRLRRKLSPPHITVSNPSYGKFTCLNWLPACATPITSLTPTLPYGLWNGVGVSTSQQTLYGSNTVGTTLEGCCNLCFFGLTNCIFAYWYFYEGCVVQQGLTVNGTGVGISDVCPNGKINGLVFLSFRSRSL